MFVDDNVFSSLAEEWRYDLGIEMSGDMSDEDLVQAAYSNISAMYAANNQQAYSLSTIPRIKKSQLSDYSVLKNFQVINVIPANIPFNETITDMRYIASDPIVAKAMSDERFEIAHTKKTDYIANIAFESGVQSVPVKVSDNIMDMPIVREELLVILNHLLTHESLKDIKLCFKSGLCVNDKNGA